MPAGELDGETPSRPFRGFSSNADDTPRDVTDELRYEDGFDEPEPEFDTFEPAQGVLTLAPREAWDEPAPPSRGVGPAVAAALVVLAVGAGFALTRGGGSTANPPAPLPTAAPALRAEATPPRNTEVATATAIPAAVAAPSKPVRQDRARQLQRSPPSVARLPEVADPPPRFVDSQVSSNASVSLPEPLAPVAPPAPARIRPSFDCGGGLTRAQQVVCGDPRLAAADRRMSRAYAEALAVGGSGEELAAEQSDWLEIREDAARYSNRAVLNIYEQRTRELEALADEGPK